MAAPPPPAVEGVSAASTVPASDSAPKDLRIGCINPRALTEVLLGRKVNWDDKASLQTMADTLQTPYEELFDMKFKSPLYSGLGLKDGKAFKLPPSQIKIRNVAQLAGPDLSTAKTLNDLKAVGVKDLNDAHVEHAVVENGKLKVQLKVPELDHTINSESTTAEIFGIAVGSSMPGGSGGTAPKSGVGWTPPGAHWQDMGDFFKDSPEFSDPLQGALGDCWLIAALSAVSWSRPYDIVHRSRPTGVGPTEHLNQLTFYSKGYGRDAPTGSVNLTDNVPVTNNGNLIIYCRDSENGEIWPGVYEKAFAAWTNRTGNYDQPDYTTLNGGDPALATAQLTNFKPYYYDTASRSADALYDLVRILSPNFKTAFPMTAWTYGSGDMYNGSNVVANHAYTILGYTFQHGKKYIVLRNPWGFLEPNGATTYQGIFWMFDTSFWRPINTISNDGVFALEASAFKRYYACIGLAFPL